MTEPRKAKSIVWAVDPWDDGGVPAFSELRHLAHAARRDGLSLIPVHVVSFTEAEAARGELPSVPEIQAAFERHLRRFAITHAEPRVILVEGGGRPAVARAVMELAMRESAECIVVSSHGRSGVERWVRGSFAELLVRHSPVPVFFLPQKTILTEEPSLPVALFPTDLSPGAHAAFQRFLPVAIRNRLGIAILHELSLPPAPMSAGFGAGALSPTFPESFAGDQVEWASHAGERLVREAREHGVKARFALDSGVPLLTGEALLAAARRERARLIAMPSMSGPWAALVAGSVAQNVFRAGWIPVWVCGPGALAARRRKKAR